MTVKNICSNAFTSFYTALKLNLPVISIYVLASIIFHGLFLRLIWRLNMWTAHMTNFTKELNYSHHFFNLKKKANSTTWTYKLKGFYSSWDTLRFIYRPETCRNHLSKHNKKKVQLYSFHLNGHAPGCYPQTKTYNHVYWRSVLLGIKIFTGGIMLAVKPV